MRFDFQAVTFFHWKRDIYTHLYKTEDETHVSPPPLFFSESSQHGQHSFRPQSHFQK